MMHTMGYTVCSYPVSLGSPFNSIAREKSLHDCRPIWGRRRLNHRRISRPCASANVHTAPELSGGVTEFRARGMACPPCRYMWQLFNLTTDEYELQNIYNSTKASNPSLVAALDVELRLLHSCVGNDCN